MLAGLLDLEGTSLEQFLAIIDRPEVQDMLLGSMGANTSDGFYKLAQRIEEERAASGKAPKGNFQYIFFDPQAVSFFYTYAENGKQTDCQPIEKRAGIMASMGSNGEILQKMFPPHIYGELEQNLLELLVGYSQKLPIVFDYQYSLSGKADSFFLFKKGEKNNRVNFDAIIHPKQVLTILIAKAKEMLQKEKEQKAADEAAEKEKQTQAAQEQPPIEQTPPPAQEQTPEEEPEEEEGEEEPEEGEEQTPEEDEEEGEEHPQGDITPQEKPAQEKQPAEKPKEEKKEKPPKKK